MQSLCQSGGLRPGTGSGWGWLDPAPWWVGSWGADWDEDCGSPGQQGGISSLPEGKERNFEAPGDTPLGLWRVLCLPEGLESCAEPEEGEEGCQCNSSVHELTTGWWFCPILRLGLPYIRDNASLEIRASLCLALPSLRRNLLLDRSRDHQSWQGSLH